MTLDISEPLSAAVPESSRINLLNLDEQGLRILFENWGEKPFRARQVLKWIHKWGESNFDGMTDLSKVLRARLKDACEVKGPTIFKEQVSQDGTRKWLMQIEGGSLIETVYIPEDSRGTLCVSSQVGCALNCSFCSTATQGFNRNLTVAEIIGQVWLVQARLKTLSEEAGTDSTDFFAITNVVMMGMGEPLLNYDAVVKAMSLMRHDEAYALPRRRVTLSTSGVVPNIERLSADADVSLALSLHAPNDALRNVLVPINKKYPISVLLDACKRYVSKNHRYKITVEYVLLRGINDTVALAKELAVLLKHLPCKINLIPFNPFSGADYERSLPEDILNFKDVLTKAGFIVTVRRTRGGDIAAACGQLVGKVIDRTQRQKRFNIKIQNREQGAVACG